MEKLKEQFFPQQDPNDESLNSSEINYEDKVHKENSEAIKEDEKTDEGTKPKIALPLLQKNDSYFGGSISMGGSISKQTSSN